MSVTFQLPPAIEAQLRAEFGASLDEHAKEALIVELYQAQKLSLGQLAQILGVGIYDADGWLKQRKVPSNYAEADFLNDLAILRRKLGE